MDSVVLPYPKIDMRVDDVDLKLENSNDGNEEDNLENYNENKELFSDSYDEINFHFMSTGDAALESKDPHRRFHCNFCGKGFIRREHLVNHKRTHTGERPFQCEYCQRSFAKQFDMTRHRQYVHCANSKLYICEKCGRTFARSDHLRKHLLTHKHLKSNSTNPTDPSQLPKSYPCDICGRTYSRIDNMKKHQKKHKENKEIKVEVKCEEESIKAEVIENGEVKIKEEIDDIAFGEVSFHFMSGVECELKDPPRRYSCEYCGRGFMRSDHLKNHKRTHTGEKPYRCDQCDRRFAKQFVMTRHKQNVHCANSKIYICEECGRTFARSDHLKNHLRVHIYGGRKKSEHVSQGGNCSIFKAFSCDECGRSYCRKDKLKKHKEKHASQETVKSELQLVPESRVGDVESGAIDDAKKLKRHTCDQCGKDFGRSDHLKTHKRTHTGEKPFQCLKCDKSFCKSTDLTRHEKTHLGIKRYPCCDCGKTFSRLDNLKTHSKIHTDAKNLIEDGKSLEKCDIRESNLVDKKFSCHFCPDVFNRKKALARHWKSKHNDSLIVNVEEVTDSSQIDIDISSKKI